MKEKLSEIDYYFITDAALSRKGILSDVAEAIDAGCRIVQYREKDKPKKDLIYEAEAIKKLCEGKALFIVNDRVDVALAVDADGVHLGQEDTDLLTARKLLGDKIIGITVHNLKEALKAKKEGADYLGVSPIYETSTKSDAGSACGIRMLKIIRGKVDLPLVGIGGINKDNAPAVVAAGADSVAAISAVVCSDNVYREVSEFIEIIKECRRRP